MTKAAHIAFAKRRQEWLDQVCRDQSLPPRAFHVAYRLAAYLNRDSGEAFPSQETLADELGMEGKDRSRAVRRLVEQLVIGGHLQVTEAHGRGRSNVYRAIVKSSEGSSSIEPENRTGLSGIEAPENRTGLSGIEAPENRTGLSGIEAPENRTGLSGIEAGKPDNPGNKTGQNCPTNLLREPSKKKSPSSKPNGVAPLATLRVTDRDVAKHFEEWWAAYPRKVEKKAAKAIFARIVKKGEATIAELLTGAKAYAGECAGKEPGYVKHPTTWLNRGCWADEPARGRPPTAIPGSQQDWSAHLSRFRKTGMWLPALGPQPGSAGCRVPAELIERESAGTVAERAPAERASTTGRP